VTDQRREGADPAVAPERPERSDRANEDPPVVCRKLRTKMSFGSLEGVRDWRHGESTTAVYWCLSTMETAGPDDGYAHPHGCRAGRACYIAPPGEEDGPALLAIGSGRSTERG
jgi:hypothetical protein